MACDKFPMKFKVFQYGYDPSIPIEKIDIRYGSPEIATLIDLEQELEITKEDVEKTGYRLDYYYGIMPIIFFKKFFNFDKYINHYEFCWKDRNKTEGYIGTQYYFKRIV